MGGQHTGRTDVPLTEAGRESGRAVGRRLAGRSFATVLTSPLARAADTCALAGYGERAATDDLLLEWDYGAYDGLTTPEIREEVPGWTVWAGRVPGGESVEQVGERADALIARLRAADGDAVLFGHGHALRVLAARWIGMPARCGESLLLSTGAIGVLGWERETPALALWNDAGHLPVD